MSQLPIIEPLLLGDVIFERVSSLSGVMAFRGQVPPDEELPLIQGDDGPDPSGRVAPFIVQFDNPGSPVIEGQGDVADRHDDLRQTFVFHCVAGYDTDCTFLAGRLRQLMYRWTPPLGGDLAGLAFGRMRPPPGYDAGSPRPNNNVSPPRFWLPQQYRLDTTT